MNGSVLVLNANYEPINICSLQRALGLILMEKASLVANGRGVVHTPGRAYPCPSVIRLDYMIHGPRPHLKLTRQEVFRRDHETCQYCGKHTHNLTIDHIVPRHLGGRHIWTNVAAACPACNHRKGGRMLTEAGMRLLHVPQEPPSSVSYIFGRYLPENTEWEPYLSGW